VNGNPYPGIYEKIHEICSGVKAKKAAPDAPKTILEGVKGNVDTRHTPGQVRGFERLVKYSRHAQAEKATSTVRVSPARLKELVVSEVAKQMLGVTR